jgi:Domain of unknown function (DUF5615)
VTVLLDENFPLGLLRRLHAGGIAAEHIIRLGWRGATDSRIRHRLADANVIFLTNDEDFLFGPSVAGIVVVSRVRQSRRLTERIEIWTGAVRELVPGSHPERLFELMDDGAGPMAGLPGEGTQGGRVNRRRKRSRRRGGPARRPFAEGSRGHAAGELTASI